MKSGRLLLGVYSIWVIVKIMVPFWVPVPYYIKDPKGTRILTTTHMVPSSETLSQLLRPFYVQLVGPHFETESPRCLGAFRL